MTNEQLADVFLGRYPGDPDLQRVVAAWHAEFNRHELRLIARRMRLGRRVPRSLALRMSLVIPEDLRDKMVAAQKEARE